ncbi:MAG: sensor histidine kinase [Bacteroidales bacterium]|jgi:signal transduction histidine kinase
MNYKKKIFRYALIICIIFIIAILVAQLYKEKRSQTEYQKAKLESYTNVVEDYLKHSSDTASVLNLLPNDIRLTIIDKNGNVLFDNDVDPQQTHDHLNRPEISGATAYGTGSAVRHSATTKKDYLYFAKITEDGNYIRTAIPYVIKLVHTFDISNLITYIAVLFFIISIIALVYFTDKTYQVIKTLKDFTTDVEEGNIDYEKVHFPDTESGEIGNKIISLYKQLEESKLQTLTERSKNQTLKQEMTNNIAHELKTPVSSIRGYLETMIMNDNISEEKQKFFINRAYDQTLRLTKIIDDVAIINKLESAPDLFKHEKVSMKKVFDEVIEDFNNCIEEKTFKFENKIGEDVEIPGNHTLIYAIFRNLSENAIRYAGKDITITAEVYDSDEYFYYFKFYDNGKGVNEKYLDKIFDRFLRIDEGRTRELGGSGLGLSIVKHSVNFHDGDIKAKNRKPSGLEFDFSLRRSY